MFILTVLANYFTPKTKQSKTMTKDFSACQFHQMLEKNHVVMAFQGVMSQEVLSLIAKSLRGKSSDKLTGKRLFGIVIELAQNIHHYSAEMGVNHLDDSAAGIGTIVISENQDEYLISSGNVIKQEDGKGILERCNHINTLNDEQLREYYLEQRRKPPRTAKPGANLGFIDMVRKAGRPLVANIINIDNQKSFFTISVSVKKHS